MSDVIETRKVTTSTRARQPQPTVVGIGANPDTRLGHLLSHPLVDYYLVLVCSSLLVALGVLMVGSASSVWSTVNNDGDAYYYLVRQVIYLLVGIPVAWFLSKVDQSWLKIFGWIGMIGSTILLILIFTPLGIEINGNRSWLSLFGGRITIQPSEFAKASLVLWMSAVLANRTKTLHQPKRLLFPVLIGFLIIEGLVVLQHDMGTALIIAIIFFAMLWFVGARLRIMAVLGGVAAILAVIGVMTRSSRKERVLGFFTGDMSDQPMNAIYALASGGWWGLGLGHSRQKWGGLYNAAQNDYVLAVLGEEMGLIGTIAVLLLFLVLTFAGIRIAIRSASNFLRYAAAGMTSWIILQALINIFVVFRMAPVVGVPLPFISQGGSALLANLIAVGVLLSAARQEPVAAEFLTATRGRLRPRMTTIVDAPSQRSSKW